MCLLVLCLMPENLLDPNDSFASFKQRLTISPVVERLVFSKASRSPGSVYVMWDSGRAVLQGVLEVQCR